MSNETWTIIVIVYLIIGIIHTVPLLFVHTSEKGLVVFLAFVCIIFWFVTPIAKIISGYKEEILAIRAGVDILNISRKEVIVTTITDGEKTRHELFIWEQKP